MTSKLQHGFTIVETMLFLAIGGILFAVLMIGVGTGITQQRYTESVRSYSALLQDQYAQVLNTRIDGTTDWQCDGSGSGTVSEGGARGARGASDCVILGRAVQIKDSGSTVVTSSVTGYDSALEQVGRDDLQAIKSYTPKLGTFDTQQSELDWGMKLRAGGQPSTAVILIVRSPASGVIKVFVSRDPAASSDLTSMITVDNTLAGATIRMCIEGDSGLLPQQVVTVNPRIAGAEGIATDTSRAGECR